MFDIKLFTAAPSPGTHTSHLYAYRKQVNKVENSVRQGDSSQELTDRARALVDCCPLHLVIIRIFLQSHSIKQ